ncbi:hypothetical protein [Flavobacterium psychrotrophum]|uniref:hypothetical protein n=1 Tax=Flavobacterium psychrotrophum TaxID=2294119 RepID=UPI000E31D3AC|nr:hypothetical protein [Flavobacterium psychrotrophum]
MAKKELLLFFISLTLLSCGDKGGGKPADAAARAGDAYLQKEELQGLVPPGTPTKDSLAIIKSYIDRWASQKLMFDAATVNIDEDKQQELDGLIRQYKTDLYTKAYLEELVKQSVDTTVTEEQLGTYYNANKDNFRTTGMLVKLRYLRMAKDHPKFGLARQRFNSGGKKDKIALNEMTLHFKNYAFNDTVWTTMAEVYQKLPFITPDNRGRYIASGIGYQYPDSLDVYLVKVNKVLDRNMVAPYEYIRPTLKEVIINNRKLELIKKIQKDITDDAIKNDKYEVYK